jgi:dihydrofolate reductase
MTINENCVFSYAGENIYVARSFEDAVKLLSHPDLSEKIERSFVIGGSSVYKVCHHALVPFYIHVISEIKLQYLLCLGGKGLRFSKYAGIFAANFCC